MSRQPTHKDKTLKAFRAYTELLDTAEWFRSELRAPLESFDLTMSEFRLLELLYRAGAQFVMEVAKIRGVSRQAMHEMIDRMESRGWVRRRTVTLPPVEFERMHWPEALRAIPRRGQRVSVVGMTKAGKKFFGKVLPSHSKVVKAFMRAISGTEQDSLARICRKLREGDVVKFVAELTHEEPED